MRSRISLGLSLAGLLLVCTRCGGGGPTAPPQPSMSISFTAAAATAPSITLTEVSKTPTSITVAVNANSVTDLFGVGFDLVWNPAFLHYQSAAEGSFLRAAGIATAFTAELVDVEPGPGEDRQQGRLAIGVGRLNAVPGVSGSGQLATVTFTSVASGTTGMSFEAIQPFDSTGTRITAMSFAGGTFTVRR